MPHQTRDSCNISGWVMKYMLKYCLPYQCLISDPVASAQLCSNKLAVRDAHDSIVGSWLCGSVLELFDRTAKLLRPMGCSHHHRLFTACCTRRIRAHFNHNTRAGSPSQSAFSCSYDPSYSCCTCLTRQRRPSPTRRQQSMIRLQQAAWRHNKSKSSTIAGA